MKFVKSILVKGEAPDGREYDLVGFGDWVAEEQIDSLPIYQSGIMNGEQVAAYWRYYGRTDTVPPSLKLWLKRNPEFVDWILLAKASDFMQTKKPQCDLEFQRKALMRAFRAGHIRTRGIEQRDARGNLIGFHDLQLNTRDFVRWLDYELEIKASINEVACWPSDATVLDLLWPDKKRRKR